MRAIVFRYQNATARVFVQAVNNASPRHLRDLHDLVLQATTSDVSWTLVGPAAKGARDEELTAAVEACDGQTARTLAWLTTLLKTSATQALVVA